MEFAFFNDKYSMLKGSFSILIMFVVTGCSLDASISDLNSVDVVNDILPKATIETDFISGEVVTTGNGVTFQGTFGELSEKKVLVNGVTIEGRFYE